MLSLNKAALTPGYFATSSNALDIESMLPKSIPIINVAKANAIADFHDMLDTSIQSYVGSIILGQVIPLTSIYTQDEAGLKIDYNNRVSLLGQLERCRP